MASKRQTKPIRRDARCMTRDCDGERWCRGVCKRCYQTYARLVAAGKTSWDELTQRGLVAAPYENRMTPALRAFAQTE